MKRRVLALFAAAVLTLTILPGASFAAETQNAMWIYKKSFSVIRDTSHAYKASYPDRKPIDVKGPSSGIDNAYAPFDCKVVKIDAAQGHMVAFESTEKVNFSNGTVDYMTFMVAHDNDISDLWVGKTFRQGDVIYQEGMYGEAGGNHIHLEVARGSFTSRGKSYGSNIWTYVRHKDNALAASQAFFLYPDSKVTIKKSSENKTWNTAVGEDGATGNSGPVGKPSTPTVSVNGQNVTVSWNSVSNTEYYNVYLVQSPWSFDSKGIKAIGETTSTSYTFTNVAPGDYRAFVIARPNLDNVQSPWASLFTVSADEPKSEPVVPTETPRLSLSTNSMNINEGSCKPLTATTTPAGKIVSWYSSDSSVATVDPSGTVTTVTGIKPGTATITASFDTDTVCLRATCEVTVIAKEQDSVDSSRPPRPSVSVNNQSVTMSWNAVANASYYNAYLVQAPWRWEDIKYTAKTSGTSCTFDHVTPGEYRAFVIARPNKDTEQSQWAYVFTVEAPKPAEQSAAPVSVDPPPVQNSVSLPVSGASGIGQTTARVDASCSYTGTRPSSVGLYLGTSPSNMSKWGSDNINHNKNPFNIWYNLSGLSAGTTYYYQFYAIVNGETVTSGVWSFTTAKASTNTRTGVVTGTDGQYLAIRSGASSSTTQIGRIPPGGTMTVYPDKTSGNWYYVSYNGVSGYAYKGYITLK